MLVFILNSLVFILIGLQLSTIVRDLSNQSLAQLTLLAALIALVVIVVRLLWVGSDLAISRGIARITHRRTPMLGNFREVFVVGWAGMRGVVSLATALVLPLAWPGRGAAIFVTFGVIVVTLVGQGLTLPAIIRTLGVVESGDDRFEWRARNAAAEAAIARIEELADEWPSHLPLIDTLRSQYQHRATHLTDYASEYAGTNQATAAEQELIEHQKIRQAVIAAQRTAVLGLRNQGAIDDAAWRKVQHDLDLEELRMEA